MTIQFAKDRKYADFRAIGLRIDRYRQRLLSMHHWNASIVLSLWWFDFRITARWTNYV